MDNYNPSVEQQNRLSELEKLVTNLRQNGIEYTIFGGYGLDGLYGKLTRDHGDIDFLTVDMENTSKVLLDMGYNEYPLDPDKIKRVFRKESMGGKWSIDFSSFEVLLALTNENIDIFVPKEDNARLPGFTFKTPTLQGQKSLGEILNKRAAQRGWKAYKHKEHKDKIIRLLEEKLP